MCHLRDALPACVKPMNLAMIDPIEARREEGALHRLPSASSLVPLLRGHRRSVGAVLVATGAACAFSCAVCPIAARAQASVADSAPRINVWGVAADARERSAVAVAEARNDDAGPLQPHLVRSVALQQSQWGDPAAPSQAALAGAARPDAPVLASVAVQATDVSYRWGLGTARSAVDVGIGAGAYRVRQGADTAAPPAPSSLPTGPGAESRRDAVVPTVSVGLRHSLSDQQRLSVYAGGSASLSSASVGEFYTTKVKVEWLPTRNSSFGFEHSAVNLRFGANGNFALRVRRGGPMIYYRSTF